ncbi:MAG: hypothetical protein ACYC5N_08705, partial [Endomicrobiales bacterium]
QNQYNRANDYYAMSAFMNANVKKAYTFLGRKATFNPSLGFTEYWSDRGFLGEKASLFVTRYYSDLNLRYRLTRSINWDVGYNFRLRTLANSLLPDFDAPDYGEETNQVYFQNYYSYSRLSIRNAASYDFRVGRYEILEDWRQKFSPLVNELTWLPRSFYTVYLREESNLYPHYLRSVQTLLNIGEPDQQYVNLGFFYQYDRPDELGFNVGFGFWPTSKWKLDYRINAAATGNYTGIRPNDQEVRLYRDLHCWEFKVAFRRRFTAEEIYFQINLKPSASANREKMRYIQQEKEFYPWR